MQESKTKELSEQEVSRRLSSYESADITKELYEFGATLMTEIQQRWGDLDAKATKIAGYSGVIISLFISTFNIWGRSLSRMAITLLLGSMSFVFAAGLIALAVWSITKFSWFSEDEWLKDECFDNADKLRRYHLLTMHGVFKCYTAKCRSKAKLIRWSGYMLIIAYGLLICVLYMTTS